MILFLYRFALVGGCLLLVSLVLLLPYRVYGEAQSFVPGSTRKRTGKHKESFTNAMEFSIFVDNEILGTEGQKILLKVP